MSSTNKTATIELSQYVSTDKPTYLVDYNGDMLKIDNAIADDRDSIATAQSTATTADGKADANKTSIDTINVQLNGDPTDPSDTGLAGDLSTVEGVVNTITSLIGNGSPTTSDQTVIGAINGLEGAIAPREDSATLANSYSQGDQFARGGSVYEALTGLTAGTAFASLVLNTDYKVADTLVQQIANAGSGALPEGYYIKDADESISVSADGVKTYAEVLYDLAQEILTTAQSLADGETMVLTRCTVGNYQRMLLSNYRYENDTTSINVSFRDVQISSVIDLYTGTISSSSAGTNYYSRGRIATDGTVTITNQHSDVATANISFGVRYYIVAPF